MNILLPFLLPVLIGVFLVSIIPAAFRWVTSSMATQYAAALGQGVGSVHWTKLGSIVLLLAQLGLIRYFGYGSSTGLLFMLLLLSALAVASNAYLKGWKEGWPAAAIYAGVFALYWIAEKYIFGSAAINWLERFYPNTPALTANMKLLAIAGISYIGFKIIHFMVDLRNGDIQSVDPIEFISWLLFFPSIVAGPMMRFQDWQEQRSKMFLTLDMAVEGLQRIAIGLFMKLVIADIIYGGTIAQLSDLTQATFFQIALGCALYTVFLFFDFAGYSHIAVGIGLFWSIRLPDNFNKPYLARNLADFWNRWHISLSTILRDYLFYPLTLTLKRSSLFKGQIVLGTMLPPLVTFLVAGGWHGAGRNFVLYGALHGIGLGVVALLKQHRKKGSFLLWWEKSLVGRIGGIATTFSYVSFTFLFFALPWNSILILWHRLIR